MKICTKCSVEKLFFDFHKQRGAADGFRSICKACRKGEHTPRYEANKVEHNARAVKWRKSNPEKVLLIDKKYRDKNSDARNQHKRNWILANRGTVNFYNNTRYASKKRRTPIWLSEFDMVKMQCLYQLAAMYSAESGFKWHVDHVVPLHGENVSGLHVPWNLRVIPARENLRKYNRHEG